MSKRNTFIQHDGMRIDEISMSDNQPSDNNMIDYKNVPFDANSIDQLEDLEEIPVHNYKGQTIGYRSELLRKKRREHYINNI